MSLSATQFHFIRLYLAAFNRAPELSGLNYWSDEVLVQGKSLQAVGGIIFSLPVVTAIYPSSISDQDFVEAIYHNVFGRSSDAEGLAYWTAEIATLRAGFAAEGSSNAAYEARGQLTMNMIEAALGTVEGTEGKAYIENRLEVAEYAVEQQLAAGTDIPVNALLDIFNELDGSDAFGKVDADAASVAWGKCEAASFFDVSAPTQLAGIVSVADDVGASKGMVANGGTTDDTAPLLTGVLDAPLALCETLAVYRNGVLIGKAAVDGASWSFADKGLANGSYAYSVRVVDLAGNQGTASAMYRINVNNDTSAPAAPSLSLASDSGSSNSDGITNLGTVNVTGLEAGASWQYSTDGGTSWTAGTGSSFTLGAGVYAAGAVQARQTDAAGNLGGVGSSASAITVDTTAPTASVTTATLSNTGSATVQSSETGTAYLVNSSVSVTNLASITGAADDQWNGVTITAAATDTSLAATGLANGTYRVYAVDAAGNLSAASGNSVNIVPPGIELADIASGIGGFVINGQATDDLSGMSVSAAGDVNGDGLADLVIGAPYATPAGFTDAGMSYVVFGKTDGTVVDLSAVAGGAGGFAINNQAAYYYDHSGGSVSAAGDVNGDGFADLIVGAYGANSSAGKSYVVFGRADGMAVDLVNVANGVGGFVINGQAGDFSGRSVSAAGDVNGDGFADLIVGAHFATTAVGAETGKSYIVFGKSSGVAVNTSSLEAGSGGFVINGQAGDASGISVSAAGDVNGDGLADLIVGASWANSDSGKSYVVFGKNSGAPTNLSDVASGVGGFVINGQAANDSSGHSVSAAGDVNGDGLADLIVGANGADPAAGSQAGKSYVVFGKANGTAVNLADVAGGAGGFVINGQAAGDVSGFSVSAAGDVNGDGLADLIVGAYYADPAAGQDAGKSYVVFGKANGSAVDLVDVEGGAGGFVIHGEAAYDQSGFSVSAAGDVNGDGLADLLVGALLADPAENYSAGKSYVIFGAVTGAFAQTAVDQLGTAGDDSLSDGGAAQTLVGGAGNDALTAANASVLYGGAGDDSFIVNDAMTAALASPLGSGGNNGQLARIDGGSGIDAIVLSGAGLNFDLTQIANQGFDAIGFSRIESVEKIDLSGTGDNALALSARDVMDMAGFNVFETTGRHQLMVTGNAGDTLNLPESGWTLGEPTSIAGASYAVWNYHFNGHAVATLYVGEAVSVTTPPFVDLAAIANGADGFVINGEALLDKSGFSVSAAGDVNGDGLDDLVVGAPYASPAGNPYAGKSYVVFGKTDGVAVNLFDVANGVGGFAINGQAADDASGFSVSAAGDVNGDGLADLIVGAPFADPATNASAGRSYVVFGKTAGAAVDLSAVAGGAGGFVINGSAAYDFSGYSVSSAGDVNGDGLADLIVGAYGAAPATGVQAGKSYVVFGKADGSAVDLSVIESGASGFVINGQDAGDNSGLSVSSAGDVNGDGLADLIVGAYGADPAAGSSAGKSYVVFGKADTAAVDLANLGTGGFVINGQAASDYSGLSVSAAGDVNGDGLADLIVGAFYADPATGTDAGKSYVIFGKTDTTAVNLSAVEAGTGGFVINGQATDDFSGYSVSAAGDMNGDGLADLIVGAHGANSDAGKSYVVFGKADGAMIDLSTIETGTGGFVIHGQAAGDKSGWSVSAAGDINGDGLADLIVGAHGADLAANADVGKSYVIFGAISGAFAQTAVDQLGTAGDDNLNDGGTAQTLAGNSGNDTLTATAASVLYAGAGNDVLLIDSAMITALSSDLGAGGNVGQLARIDGGSGIDTLWLSGAGLNLDLTQIANIGFDQIGFSRIESVEKIDLTGTGNNTLTLGMRDVMDMAGFNTFAATGRHQVMVTGNAGDTLDLVDAVGTSDWTQGADVTLVGVSFAVWNSSNGLATLYVDTAVSVI